MAMAVCPCVDRFITMVQTEISQQLQDGLPPDLVQIPMVLRGWILKTLPTVSVAPPGQADSQPLKYLMKFGADIHVPRVTCNNLVTPKIFR